jgi:V8-like Glu-specific endopeptidase
MLRLLAPVPTSLSLPKSSSAFSQAIMLDATETNLNLHRPVSKPNKHSTVREILPSEISTQGDRGSVETAPSLAAERLIVTGKGPLIKSTPTHGVARILGAFPETVIFTDDRVLVNAPEKFPWRMICSLEIQGSLGGTGIGTGWFIGPKTIATAGHCVFHPSLGGWAEEIIIHPGRYDLNNRVFPYPKSHHFTKPIVSKRFEAVNGWLNTLNPDFDYAVIHLDEPVGEETGWFSVAVKDDTALQGSLVNISGYPGDKDLGRRQYFASSKVGLVTPTRIFYEADTYGGQSGSPAWVQDDINSIPQVVGIHSYGVGGSFTLNSATRITAEIFGTIKQWIQSDS